MKRERLITAEIEEQNDMVAISLLEMIASWQKGFNEVNKLYGTDIQCELNPVLLKEIAEQFSTDSNNDETVEETTATVEEESPDEEEVVEDTVTEEETTEPEVEEETVEDQIEELEEVVDAVIDTIIDADDEGVEADATQESSESGDMVE